MQEGNGEFRSSLEGKVLTSTRDVRDWHMLLCRCIADQDVAMAGLLLAHRQKRADKEDVLPTIVAMMPAEEMAAIPAGVMAMMNTCAGMQTAGALLCTMDEENFMLTRTCQKTCNALSCGEFPNPFSPHQEPCSVSPACRPQA